jgi:hypothetical protein
VVVGVVVDGDGKWWHVVVVVDSVVVVMMVAVVTSVTKTWLTASQT